MERLLAIVAHSMADMPWVEDPAESLHSCISRVDGRVDVAELDLTASFPFVDGIPLYVDMARAGSGPVLIDHGNGFLVVFINERWAVLREAKLAKHRVEVLGNLFSSGRGGGSFWLHFGLKGNSTTSKGIDNASDGAPGPEISGMCSINIANKLM
jgi:hypothetical protein